MKKTLEEASTLQESEDEQILSIHITTTYVSPAADGTRLARNGGYVPQLGERPDSVLSSHVVIGPTTIITYYDP